ncbi:MAG: ATP-binding protein [Planctomycetota bacterium]
MTLHSTAESIGAVAAILMAIFALQRKTAKNNTELFFPTIAFISMGIMDGFHAAILPGNDYILLHSIAVLAGGFFFALSWLPERIISYLDRRWAPYGVAVFFGLFGLGVLSFRESLPIMVSQGNFTVTALAINLSGGGLFIVGMARFLVFFRRTGNLEFYLFSVLMLLFGLSALISEYSSMWSANYWFLHILRLLAYLLTLGFVIRLYHIAAKRLEHINAIMRAIVKVNQLITREKDAKKLIREACKDLIETRGYYNAWIILINDKYDIIADAEAGAGEKFSAMKEQVKNRQLPHCWNETAKQGKLFVINDRKQACSECPMMDDSPGRSAMSIKLQYETSSYGFMVVSLPQQFANDSEEQNLFTEISRSLSSALYAVELEKQRLVAEERYHTLISNVPVGIYRNTPGVTGHFIMANLAIAKMFGYDTIDEFMKSSVAGLYVDPADRKVFSDRLSAEGNVFGAELRLKRKDGTPIWGAVSARICRNEKGEIEFFDGMIEDITRRKISEELLSSANEELRRKTIDLANINRELESFNYSVSHDLRAPLRSIDGFSQILLEDYGAKLDDEAKNYLNRVRAASNKMAELIDDMLNLSRISRSVFKKEKVDLSALAQSIIEEHKNAEPQRRVEAVITPEMVVDGDSHLLKIAFNNLIGNAWKFTGKQDLARIEMGFIEKDGAPVYFIRDNGVGYEMKYADKLFGAFQRLHAASDFPGTGIGLAIVQRVIHRHGGKIWTESAVGKGAAFYFTL